MLNFSEYGTNLNKYTSLTYFAKSSEKVVKISKEEQNTCYTFRGEGA